MLIEHLYNNASKYPQQVAVIDASGSYTFGQLGSMAGGLSMYLSMQTRQPRVGLLLPASVGFVASFYGTLTAGKTVVPINFLLDDSQVAHVIKDSGIDTVLTIAPLATKLKDAQLNVIDLLSLPSAPPSGINPNLPQRDANETAVLMYTSGTSGMPKGVELTFENLQADVDAAIEHAQLKTQHRFLGIIPLFHAFGMTAMMLAPIQLGATVVYLARFNPTAALAAIREHQISLMFGVPSMYAAIANLKNASADDFKSIYALISGGEPLPRTLYENFKSRFGVPIFEGYGLTETSPVVALNVPQSHKIGSVGKLVPGASVKIVDDDGKSVPPDQSGEVWLSGPMIMKGYFNLPNETAAALTSERFFKTGDLGMIDSDGFLHITGRKKDLIIVAGEKVTAREVEEALLLHPAIAEAAVVGKKDPTRGEVVAAFVVLKPGNTIEANALRDHCRQVGLAQWKSPRDVQFVNELPHSPTGKVLKRILVERIN